MSISEQLTHDEINDLKYNSGINGINKNENIPNFKQAKHEKIIHNNNSHIVLGRDRIGNRTQGYGAKGFDDCSSIDLVAGRYFDKNSLSDFIDNDFSKDRTRIYISEKCDIDFAFGLNIEENYQSIGKSSIGIKADAVRIIGDEGIKLITKVNEKNSLDGHIITNSGIDLCANNDFKKLQPIPKGDNLIKLLEDVYTKLDDITNVVDTLCDIVSGSLDLAGFHTHICTAPGVPSAPSIEGLAFSKVNQLRIITELKTTIANYKINLEFTKNSYLKEYGNNYINSNYNKVN